MTLIDPVVSEEMFENVDTHTDDRGLPIRRLSGELKMPRDFVYIYIGCPGCHIPGRQVNIIVMFPIMSAFNVFRHQSICYDYNQSLEIELYARKKSNVCSGRIEKSGLWDHCSASLCKAYHNDPGYGFYYPHLTRVSMKNSYL